MASSTKNKILKKQPLYDRGHRLLFLLVLLFFALAGYWLIRTNLTLPRQETRLFLATESRLDDTLKAMTATPVSKSRYCNLAQQEFGKGPLGCSIDVSFDSSYLKPGITDNDILKALANSGFEVKAASGPEIEGTQMYVAPNEKLNCYFQIHSTNDATKKYRFNCSGAATKNINWN